MPWPLAGPLRSRVSGVRISRHHDATKAGPPLLASACGTTFCLRQAGSSRSTTSSMATARPSISSPAWAPTRPSPARPDVSRERPTPRWGSSSSPRSCWDGWVSPANGRPVIITDRFSARCGPSSPWASSAWISIATWASPRNSSFRISTRKQSRYQLLARLTAATCGWSTPDSSTIVRDLISCSRLAALCLAKDGRSMSSATARCVLIWRLRRDVTVWPARSCSEAPCLPPLLSPSFRTSTSPSCRAVSTVGACS